VGTFVLVHGAMHGGWCWRGVRQRLSAAGHDVYTPTLTGQGDRRQSLTPNVGLETHVTDLTDLLWFEDLRDVTLVLHSYSGLLAGPVAERAGERLSAVVAIGALIARPGQSMLEVEPPQVAARYRQSVETNGNGWLLRASPAFLAQWAVPQPLHELVGLRLTDFPLRCLSDAAVFDPSALAALPRTYVWHTDPPLANLERSRAIAQVEGWELRELRSGHDMMLEAPEETAALLEDLCE
jgi:pimeloyl-ACP methyl ester carboxylesterase